MALLVDLIEADDLNGQELFHISHVGLGAGEAGDTGAGQGHLGGGGKLDDHIGVAGILHRPEDIGELHIVPFKLMDAVGVVPHQQ